MQLKKITSLRTRESQNPNGAPVSRIYNNLGIYLEILEIYIRTGVIDAPSRGKSHTSLFIVDTVDVTVCQVVCIQSGFTSSNSTNYASFGSNAFRPTTFIALVANQKD